jgi:hypothetical protein
MVDPFLLGNVEDLREALLSLLDDHLEHLNPVPRVVFGDPFFFVRSHLIEVPTGLTASTLLALRTALAEVDVSAIYLHALDARARRGIPGGQFAQWIGDELGLDALAEQVGRLNPYVGGLERLRTQMLALIDAELGAAPAPGADR